jgi:hypothetical protein
MAILKTGSDNNYLLDYKHGRIKKGLGISCDLDKHLRFKRGQYVGILGGNNVGKTYFMAWYFLCLSVKHNLKWGLWMDENKKGRVMRDLIQWYTGQRLKDLTDNEILVVAGIIENYFFFIDNKEIYKPAELLELFKSRNPDGVLLDPFNQLNRPVGYSENVPFVRTLKHWCKTTDTTLYLTMHPNTETQRKSSQYPEKHEWAGQPMMPLKHNAEGGSTFSNMADDWINLNRLNKLESMKYITMLDVDKVKDVDTGGSITGAEEPLMFHFNNGLGFTMNGKNPLEETQKDFYRTNGENKNLNNYANNNF